MHKKSNSFIRSRFFQLSIFDDYGSDRETDKKKERQRQIDRAREIERERERERQRKDPNLRNWRLLLIMDRDIGRLLHSQIYRYRQKERQRQIDRQKDRQINTERERERQVSLQDRKITMREDTKYESKDPNIPNCCNREIERQINQIV